MQLQEHKKSYVSENEIYSFQDTLGNDISFKVFVECSTEKFVQYQKDILEEFVADFTNTIKDSDELDTADIKEIFEQSLQLLNTKLKQFAEKVRDVEHFHLKGLVQLVVDDMLMSSMIGEVSMMILRDGKALYSISNSVDNKSKIDLCSDFIEGRLERDDQIIYVGLKFADVMDQHDRKEMENLLAEEESADWVLSFIEELLLTRVEKRSIWFVISYLIQGPTINVAQSTKRGPKLWRVTGKWKQYLSSIENKFEQSELLQNVKKQISENKIYVIWLILVVLILIFVYSLLTKIINDTNNVNKFQTASGTYIDLNLKDLQTEINEFKALDASSNLKTSSYTEISNKLNFLESQWKRLEDVASLRSQLEENYLEWFRVTPFKNVNELNTIAWRNTQVLTFNSSDLSKLWTLNSIVVPNNNIMVWGSKWALIGASSDSNRWTLIDYGVTLDSCIASLNSNGLYCYNNGWDIYMISKTGIVPVWAESEDFHSGIGWLWTYNGRNLYVFQSNVSSLWNILLTRYQTNSDWTYANFKKWSSYSVGSGKTFGTFSSFAIDGNFFGRANGKLYLFWREDTAGTSLVDREIPIKWWNPFTKSYSDNVKVITSSSTEYVYTYDKDQQLFTVYDTEKTKLNEDNKRAYQLVYMFSLKFDIDGVKVYDVDVLNNTWDRPELFLLSDNGINKIALYEYIEAMK